MKKLMIPCFLAMSFFILPACHKEGKDNNMNDAYEQTSRCQPQSRNDGNRHDVRSGMDSTAHSKSYSDTSRKK